MLIISMSLYMIFAFTRILYGISMVYLKYYFYMIGKMVDGRVV